MKPELVPSHWCPGKGERQWAQIETKGIPLNQRRNFCPVGVIKHWVREEVESVSLERIQYATEYGPEQPANFWTLLWEGLDLKISRGPFPP